MALGILRATPVTATQPVVTVIPAEKLSTCVTAIAAQRQNGSYGTPRAPLVKAALLRNLKICDGLAMLDPDNLAKLRRGNAPVVRRGPYAGQIAEVDYIVPLAEAGQIGNELANLELPVGERNSIETQVDPRVGF